MNPFDPQDADKFEPMEPPDLSTIQQTYKYLGENPVYVPIGNWVRMYCSDTGNVELWADHTTEQMYRIVCD